MELGDRVDGEHDWGNAGNGEEIGACQAVTLVDEGIPTRQVTLECRALHAGKARDTLDAQSSTARSLLLAAVCALIWDRNLFLLRLPATRSSWNSAELAQ